jgi:hypothetical protein
MRHLLAAVAGIALAVSGASAAPIVGYFTDFNAATTAPAAGITAVGYTPQQITNIGTQNFAGLNMVVINETNNGTPSAALLGRTADLATYVANGGVLIVHSRNVTQGTTDDNQWVPGMAGVALTTAFGTDINVVTPGILPGITNTNLDGGNFSSHGFGTAVTLPTGATNILSTANANESVAFGYSYGSGFVYYSTIPLDFYLDSPGGEPRNTFRTTYYQDVLRYANARVAAVPEPLSIAVFGGLVGVGGLAARRRMKVAA